MPQYGALCLLAMTAMARLALSAPTSSATPDSTHPSTLLNITNPLTSSLVRRQTWEDDHWDKWAQFCDDDNCSQNCGQSVLMSNVGCLEQPLGRKSIKIHGGRRGLEAVKLIVSPRKGCHCQAFCSPVEWQGPHISPQQYPLKYGTWPVNLKVEYCWTISAFEWYNKTTEWSFHFKQEEMNEEAQCWPDQCGWDNKPLTAVPPH